MSSVSLAIIASDDSHRNELAGIIGMLDPYVDISASASNFAEGVGKFREKTPQIVILEVSDVGQGVRETSALLSQFPGTSIFVTCDHKNPDWILSLIRAGAGEYLTRPINATELIEAVKKATRQYSQGGEQRGMVTALYNPVGGMGTSTIAVNLAVALAAQDKGAALVDLNQLSPDISTFLDLAPRYNLGTLSSRNGELDGNFLKSVVTRHQSGIDVLTGTTAMAGLARLEPARLERLLAVSRTLYGNTVVDSGGGLEGCNLSLLAESDLVLYVTVLSLPALKNAKRYLPEMASHLGGERLKVVVNRYNAKDEISVADAEKVLGHKVFAKVPDCYGEVRNSINQGDPLVCSYPKSPFVRAISELSARISDVNQCARRSGLI